MKDVDKEPLAEHPFWGKSSALSSLGFVALLVSSTGRMAFALIAAAALLWVTFSAKATLLVCAKILPKRAGSFISLLLAVFYSNVFLIVLNLYSPILALESIYLILLAPVIALSSGWLELSGPAFKEDSLLKSLWGALAAGSVFLGLGLLREPFGYGALSLPGPHGVLEFFGSDLASSVAIRFIAGTSGALIVLGYIIALFQVLRSLLAQQAVQQEAKGDQK